MDTASKTSSHLSGLNAEQLSAVTHEQGPLLILAGAGTGKTRTLVARVAHLISQGTAPERILLVTFSRRASEEMIRRVGELSGAATSRRLHAGTFHSIANRLLRIHGEALGLAKGFSVLDQADAADLFGFIRTDHGQGQKRRFAKKETLASIYSRTVNTQLPLTDVLQRWFPWCATDAEEIGKVFSEYTARKRAQDLLDYDDLLLFWHAAAVNPKTGPAMAKLYDHILVDEYQDTNTVQSDTLRALRGNNDNITVVGDDAQSIYSFRAATVRNIFDFPTHFKGASTISLEQNYRSTQGILDLANAVIEEASERHSKNLWSADKTTNKPVLATCPDEMAQAEATCNSILAQCEQGMALREQAVLFRAAHHSDLLEVELRRRNIPFVKYGGLKFLDASHVRDLLALLRILDNPFDELAWFRVLQFIDGVGTATANNALAGLGVRERTDTSPLSAFINGKGLPAKLDNSDEVIALRSALSNCADDGLAPGAQIERLGLALEPILRRRHENAEVRLRDLDQLAILATEYRTRSELVAELTLDPPTSTGDFAGAPTMDDDYLTLSTVHSAKGGEWKAVHVIHAADGMFPSDIATGDAESIDEERRLFYVAITRAREQLNIFAPLRYHHAGKGWSDAHSYAQRTRFLPPSVDALLEHRAVRSSTLDDVGDSLPPVDITQSVDTLLQHLW